VIGDARPLAWVLAEQRMAFPTWRRHQVAALEIGDELFIYTTRGCFHNPNRDRGLVIGLALVSLDVRDLPKPVVFGERRFSLSPMGGNVVMRLFAVEWSRRVAAAYIQHLFVSRPDPNSSWRCRYTQYAYLDVIYNGKLNTNSGA
jgi:hypothetical protein